MRYARGVQLGLMWASALQIAPAFAQTGSIFTCTDAQGRHLSSERLRAEERARAEAQVRARSNDERRLQQALLMRYRDQAAHQRERALALQPIQAMRQAALQRQQELEQQRRAAADEWAELQRADPTKAPPARLAQRKADLEQQLVSQDALVQGHQRELERIEQRFDAELRLLQRLWAERDAAAMR